MSKLESDEVVLEEIPFNLNSISEEILGVIEHMATEQNIRIIWEEKEVTHWNLIGSPVHVKRILMNILSNAVKYNKENGYVYISCREIPSKQTHNVYLSLRHGQNIQDMVRPARRKGSAAALILCTDFPKRAPIGQTRARIAHFASETKNSPYCTIFSRFFWQYS